MTRVLGCGERWDGKLAESQTPLSAASAFKNPENQLCLILATPQRFFFCVSLWLNFWFFGQIFFAALQKSGVRSLLRGKAKQALHSGTGACPRESKASFALRNNQVQRLVKALK